MRESEIKIERSKKKDLYGVDPVRISQPEKGRKMNKEREGGRGLE